MLDTTDPADIAAVDGRLDLDHTLFIVASKSGTTLETLSHLAYLWERIPDGAHFIAITDPGTPLETTAYKRGFRGVFNNPPEIGGRYSALSYFGLVPAALIGVDLDQLLARAAEMQRACDECVPAPDNPGAWLGAVLGEGALAGRDELTLLLPDALASLGTWIEQLIAESTGKEGAGILPVEGEPLGSPDVYGDRRLFVAIGDHDGLDALEAAGHPVVRLPYDDDPYQLGAEFFRWEFATAIAGHVLGINAFDQPNVQQAKDATARILGGDEAVPDTLALDALLDGVGAGDYVAIQAYVPRTAESDARLQAARLKLRDRLRVPTTVGYGPPLPALDGAAPQGRAGQRPLHPGDRRRRRGRPPDSGAALHVRHAEARAGARRPRLIAGAGAAGRAGNARRTHAGELKDRLARITTEGATAMKMGLIGLGRMGAGIAERLRRDGHEVVGYDRDPAVSDVDSLEALVAALEAPRVVWVMVPSGDVTERTLGDLKPLLAAGDIVIEGGNSYYRDSMRRAEEFTEASIHYVDAGTSGGIWGLEVGFCLMVGGPDDAVHTVEPLLRTLAPEDGYAHVGPSGAGHFTKMIHNGIEYGMMQAYAEGFELLQSAEEFGIDLPKVASLWNHGSVVRSWLLELAERAFNADPKLEGLRGYADDSGEGRWTVIDCIERGVPAGVIAQSIFARFASRDDNSFAMRTIAALRNEFGGHAVQSQ